MYFSQQPKNSKETIYASLSISGIIIGQETYFSPRLSLKISPLPSPLPLSYTLILHVSVHCTYYCGVQFTVFGVQCILYILRCTVNVVLSTLQVNSYQFTAYKGTFLGVSFEDPVTCDQLIRIVIRWSLVTQQHQLGEQHSPNLSYDKEFQRISLPLFLLHGQSFWDCLCILAHTIVLNCCC